METEVIDTTGFVPGDFLKFTPTPQWLEENRLRGTSFLVLVIGMNQGTPILRVFNPYTSIRPKRNPSAIKVGTPTGFSFQIEPGAQVQAVDVTVWYDGSQGKLEAR